MAVDRRVPVVAAVEGRRQLARRPDVVVAGQHVGDLVGVLAVDALQRQTAEALGELGVEVLGHCRRAERGEEKRHE